jgi:hypothetical protein
MAVKNPAPGVLIHEGWYADAGKLLGETLKAAQLEYSITSWKRSSTGVEGKQQQTDYRSSVESNIGAVFGYNDKDFLPLETELKAFCRELNEKVNDFRSVYDLHLRRDEGFTVIRYQNKAEYHFHHDHAEQNQRALSMVCFLNDDFVGGELEFPYFDLKITPVAGTIVLFPSNFPYGHIAHPVEEGTKYSLVTWYS